MIHLKTLHLGPEELLVAAKVGRASRATASEVAARIDAAERAVREAEPIAQVIYIEPDIVRRGLRRRPSAPEPPAPLDTEPVTCPGPDGYRSGLSRILRSG